MKFNAFNADSATNPIRLTPAGSFSTGVFDESAAEIVAHDPETQRLFVVNSNLNQIDVLDISAPAFPRLVQNIDLTEFGNGGGVNSVDFQNGILAAAVENADGAARGAVVLLNAEGEVLADFEVGVLPDMVTFTPDGTKILTANEGEPTDEVDPFASVGIIDISGGIENATSTLVGFGDFNDRVEELRDRGVRIFGSDNVARDLEPEYITVSDDSSIAYVSLQENNALAVVDLDTATVLDILPLGFKDHSQGLPELSEFDLGGVLAGELLGTTLEGEDIPLGGLSGLFFEGTTEDGTFLFLTNTDRGPDAGTIDIDGDGDSDTRLFTLPELQPEVVRFEFDPESGAITIRDRIGLTDAEGNPLTGLPNVAGDDGGLLPADLDGNPLAFDPLGADLEGIVVNPANGDLWLADEYRPSIYQFNSEGELLNRYIPNNSDDAVGGTETLPGVLNSARDNRGFEAISLDTETGILYAFIQTPLGNNGSGEFDRATSDASQVIRIVGIDPADGSTVAQYVYLLERPQFSEGNVDKIGDAVFAGDGKFFVIERDSGTTPVSTKPIYEIDISDATNLVGNGGLLLDGLTLEQHTPDQLAEAGIEPVEKREVTNLPSLGYLPSDKPEGLALLPDGSLAVLNDNDFEPDVKDTTLGIVSFTQSNQLDASDRDDAINLQNWPVFGMYQPDTIDSFTADGITYIVTANEGDARGFEEVRVEDLTLDPEAFGDVDALQAEDALGRLEVTNTLGSDGDVFDELFVYGGRSFSIFDQFGNLVFDSGDQLERLTAEFLPEDFNATNDENGSFDSRSDAKGPEPEGVAIGEVNGTTYAFIGLERIGGIATFDLSNPSEPEFVQYVNNRDFSVEAALDVDGEDVTNPAVGDLGPEGLTFISAEDSPNGRPLLAVGNEVSGTTTLFEISIPTTLTFGSVGDDSLDSELDPGFGGANQVAFAGAGNDTIDISTGGGGNRVFGGSGNDEFFASTGDRFSGGAGADIFDATTGSGDNRLSGGDGDDDFFLGAGDRVLGGAGSDRLFAGTGGNNILTGGTGSDQFWIANAEAPASANTVTDFTPGEDVLGIGGLGVAFGDLTLAGDTVSLNGDVLAILSGIDATALTADNFAIV